MAITHLNLYSTPNVIRLIIINLADILFLICQNCPTNWCWVMLPYLLVSVVIHSPKFYENQCLVIGHIGWRVITFVVLLAQKSLGAVSQAQYYIQIFVTISKFAFFVFF